MFRTTKKRTEYIKEEFLKDGIIVSWTIEIFKELHGESKNVIGTVDWVDFVNTVGRTGEISFKKWLDKNPNITIYFNYDFWFD